ncbi:MAG: hypothetical protein IKG96_03220 [Bacteroidaceae bacterium]|nr:hypothetical protein [Bacteroidaceae bacterium]
MKENFAKLLSQGFFMFITPPPLWGTSPIWGGVPHQSLYSWATEALIGHYNTKKFHRRWYNCTTALELFFVHSETTVPLRWNFCPSAVEKNFVRRRNIFRPQSIFISSADEIQAHWGTLQNRLLMGMAGAAPEVHTIASTV